jgi:hypothetical protein
MFNAVNGLLIHCSNHHDFRRNQVVINTQLRNFSLGYYDSPLSVLALPHRLSKDVFKVLRLHTLCLKKYQQTLPPSISAYDIALDPLAICDMDDPSLSGAMSGVFSKMTGA